MTELQKYVVGLSVRKLEIIISCSFFLTLTVVILRGILFSPGVVVHEDWIIPPFRAQIIHDFPAGFFSAWQNGMDYTVNSRGQLVLGLANRLVSSVFSVNGEQLSKVYVFLTVSFSGLGMFFVGRAFKKSWLPSLIAGVFYMLMPWVFDRIVNGDFSRMFAYALFPVCFFLFFKSVELKENKNNDIICSIIIGLLLLVVDNSAFVVIFATLMFYSIFRVIFFSDRKKAVFANTKSLITIFLIFILSNLYWLLPSFVSGQQTNALSLATFNDLISHSSNTLLINVFRSTSNPTGGFLGAVTSNVASYPSWILISFLIPILVFSVLLFRPKNKNVFFFSLLAIIALFLGKGINPPFGQAYLWVYLNIPYAQVFRDPDKWVMPACMAYSFLLLFSTDLIISCAQRIKWPFSNKIRLFSWVNFGKVFSASIALMLLTVFFVSSYPFLSGDFSGQLKAVDFPSYYQDAYEWLGGQSGDFKVLWLPPDIYTQYDWVGSSSYEQRDMMATYSPKPNLMVYSASGVGYLSYFVASALYDNTTCYLGKILAIADVKYIFLRNDADGWWWRNLGWTQDKLNYVMQHQSGLKLVQEFGMIDIYLNEYYTSNGSAISATNDVTLVSGGFSSLTSLTYAENMAGFYPVFAEQIPQDSILAYTESANSLIIQNGDFSSFIFSFIPQQYLLDPSNYATEGDKTMGWATLYGANYFWLNPGYLDSVGEIAITDTNAALNIPFSSLNVGQYNIWIKAFWDPNLNLTLSFDGIQVGDVNSNSFDSLGYSWIEVNSIILKPGNHVISIQNKGLLTDGSFSETLVSSMALVPEDVMKEATECAINATSDKNILLLYEAEMAKIDNFSNSWALNSSFGLNASQGLAITSKAYSPIPYDIFVPKSGNYEVSLRVNSPQRSGLDVSIESRPIHVLLNQSNNFEWLNLTTQYLSQGEQLLQVATGPGVSLDLVMLKSLNNQSNSSSVPSGFSYTENSPTNYVVGPRQQGSLFLFFDQSYDPGWKASVNGTKIDSVPVCSGFNLFLINGNMTGTVSIEFVKQTYFEVGLYFGLVIFLAMAIFCVYIFVRRRYIRK